MLLEAQGSTDGRLDWLIMGLGVNISSHPQDTTYPATDLQEMGSGAIEPALLLRNFLSAFSPLYDAWTKFGFSAIGPIWNSHAVGLGREIEVRLDQGTVAGRFLSLGDDGALVLELSNGQTRRIAAGEVFFPWLFPALAGS